MNDHFSDIYRAFDGVEQIQLVSISVDPAVDSVATLADYAASRGVDDNRWVFLTGPIDTVIAICEGYFQLAAVDLPGGHSTKFALVDRDNNIRAYYTGTDAASVNVLRSHLRQLLSES